jgi:hypothetical protein
MADTVRVNGALYDQGSTELKIAGEPVYGYNAVAWSQKRTRVKGYSQGKDRAPKGRTRGKYEVENLKITVYRKTASEIKKLFASRASDGQSYGNPDDVPIVFQYIEDESNQAPVLVEFIDCAVASDGGNSEEDGPDMVEMEFDYMRLDETIDGQKVTLYDAS